MSKEKVVYFRIDVMSGSTGKMLVALHLPENATIDEAADWMAANVDELVADCSEDVSMDDDWDTFCKATMVEQIDARHGVDIPVFRGRLGKLIDVNQWDAEQDDTEVLA